MERRGLKQVSHKKPFKKLFLDVSRLGESRGLVAKIFASREQAANESPKFLDELTTGVSRMASLQLSREKL